MRVIDFDSHVVEPEAVWAEYLEPEYRVPARSVFWVRAPAGGPREVVLNGRVVRTDRNTWLQRAATGVGPSPAGNGAPGTAGAATGAADAAARLRAMDESGVDTAVLFPTYFGEYFPVVDNADVSAALARAYNDWIIDFCTADRDRLRPAALLPLASVVSAREELERVRGRGVGVVALRPVLVGGERFLNHPDYEPLWRDIEAAGIVAAIHPSPGGDNPEWTSHGPFVEKVSSRGAQPPPHGLAEVIAPFMDNSTFLVGQMFYAFLERFDRLRLVLLHSGASWLPLMLEKIEGYLKITYATSLPVRVDADRVFYGHGQAMVGFDADEEVVCRLSTEFAPVAVWGSRYPNHDCMSAVEAMDRLRAAGVPEPRIEAMMGGNASRLLADAGQPAEERL